MGEIIKTNPEDLIELFDHIDFDNGWFEMSIEKERLEREDGKILIDWDIILDLYNDGKVHIHFWDRDRKKILKSLKVLKGKREFKKVVKYLLSSKYLTEIFRPMLKNLGYLD
ncbi:MAG: hypothetical protein QXS37_06575 [Candidatus Aenigmatarchaeota archaeon]